jgi:hypothetical protein
MSTTFLRQNLQVVKSQLNIIQVVIVGIKFLSDRWLGSLTFILSAKNIEFDAKKVFEIKPFVK